MQLLRPTRECPAYGKTCQSCGRPNHFSKLCWQTMELESSINETVHDMTEGTLPHQTWKIRRPAPVATTANPDGRNHHEPIRLPSTRPYPQGGGLQPIRRSTGGYGMPELSGWPPTHGLEKRDLIPASLTMRSASGNQLPIIGAALTRIRLTQSGRETRQMVYISPIATKLYLSLSTCTDLGLIRNDFPRGQSTASIQAKGAVCLQSPRQPEKEPATARPCHCPDRAPPPQPDRVIAQTEHHLHSGQPHCHTPPRREVGEVPTRDVFVQHIQHLASTRLCL